MTPTETLRIIDKRIDGIRSELFRRSGRVNTLSCHDWQLAWERNPDLHSRQSMLFGLRDLAQLARDAEIERAYRAEQRRLRHSFPRFAQQERVA